MSRWFRWHEGTTEDGKFRVVARLSRVTIRDVIALWAFILEDAANLDHRGVCKRNEDFMASILDFDDGTVERILDAMESADMISVGHGAITVCNWGKRQFEGDTDPTAADRQRRKRERDKTASHGPVTRDSRPPDTETDTQTEKKEDSEANASGAEAPKVVPIDARTSLFRDGLQAVRDLTGKSDGQARSLIGKWLKERGDDAASVHSVIQRAIDLRPAEPIPWIEAAMKARTATPEINYRAVL